jgi:hypothetical protein
MLSLGLRLIRSLPLTLRASRLCRSIPSAPFPPERLPSHTRQNGSKVRTESNTRREYPAPRRKRLILVAGVKGRERHPVEFPDVVRTRFDVFVRPVRQQNFSELQTRPMWLGTQE